MSSDLGTWLAASLLHKHDYICDQDILACLHSPHTACATVFQSAAASSLVHEQHSLSVCYSSNPFFGRCYHELQLLVWLQSFTAVQLRAESLYETET